MKKATIYLNDEVWKAGKHKATRARQSFSSYVASLIDRDLSRKSKVRSDRKNV